MRKYHVRLVSDTGHKFWHTTRTTPEMLAKCVSLWIANGYSVLSVRQHQNKRWLKRFNLALHGLKVDLCFGSRGEVQYLFI